MLRCWWSVTPRSMKVNVARHCCIFQVTRATLAKTNLGSKRGEILRSQDELVARNF